MDPVILVKILLIQRLFSIKSMRQTIKEIETNVAYRWYLGFKFLDKVPHYGTFSKIIQDASMILTSLNKYSKEY
ncbi:transposase [Mammaliicoccus lentus]|uniref:transposase n=1 Tax=Mammaliicoccus lentus TaxID=42858 RepID=UPI0026485428|nr:transposase [Mammaliicoccus lentus]